MTTPELLPCPFCGHPPKAYAAQVMVNGDCPESIDCINDACPMQPSTGYMPFDEAVAAWNTRAPLSPAVLAELPEVKELIRIVFAERDSHNDSKVIE